MTIAGFEITVPVLLLGLVTGLSYGILAVGLVLIHRSNRIINFAHGEIGVFGAAVLGVAVNEGGVPYWVAFVLALAISAGIGALAEVLVIRRLRRAPAIMSVVATLGLALLLLLLSLVVNGNLTAGRLFPQPAGLPSFQVGPLFVSSAYSGMLLLVPALVLGLTLFLKRSRYGLAIRAAAANPDAARLSAVFTSRMSTLSWAIAGAVAAVTAVLVLPTRGFISTEFLGPGLLLRALAAAVLARMTSLPIALAAGVGVGVIEQLLLWNDPRGGLVEMILFLLVLGTLLVQTKQGGRSEDKASWATVQPWPPMPDAWRAAWLVRHGARVVAGVALLAALVLPLVVSNASAVTLVVIMAFALVGLSVGIVTGLSGQLSLGQFALAGVGAWASYLVTFATGSYVLGFLAAGAAAAAVSLVIGLPALRIKGLMLAVTTLGFALAAQSWLFGQPWVFGDGTDPGRPIVGSFVFDTGRRYYYVALAVLVAGFVLARNVWHGGIGRRLRAVRDNEDGARAFTVPATLVKLQGFVLAGFLAGLGGAAYGHALSRISPATFPVDANIDTVAVAVLGGVGLLAGPLLGALYIVGVPEFLPLDNAGLAATSLGWLLLVLSYPGGIAQALAPARERVLRSLVRLSGRDPDAVVAEEAAAAAADAAHRRTASLVRPVRTPAPPDRPLLEVAGIRKRFGGIKAVDGVDLAVRPGEIVGLIGPNGAGKTTLFELIGGFTKPDEGRVVFKGVDVSRSGPEGRARLGLVRSFQDAALFPTMTVQEAVQLAFERVDPTRLAPALAGLAGGDRRKAAKARELIDLMGLGGYRAKQILELSTGTRRIAEIACLVALEPELLLLDEPSSGVAQRETEALGDLLRGLHRQLDLTLVIVEHDIPLLMRLCDRIVAMESGRVIADGTPDEVRNDPLVIESYLGGDPTAIERSGAAVGAPVGPPTGRAVTSSRAPADEGPVAGGAWSPPSPWAPATSGASAPPAPRAPPGQGAGGRETAVPPADVEAVAR